MQSGCPEAEKPGSTWMFPKMVVPNNHGVFLLKMIILGCFGGTIIKGNTHMTPVLIGELNFEGPKKSRTSPSGSEKGIHTHPK